MSELMTTKEHLSRCQVFSEEIERDTGLYVSPNAIFAALLAPQRCYIPFKFVAWPRTIFLKRNGTRKKPYLFRDIAIKKTPGGHRQNIKNNGGTH